MPKQPSIIEKGVAPDYLRLLLNAFPPTEPEKGSTNHHNTSIEGLIELLTECELDVLKLIAAGLSWQEIANELIVSVNTVKTHARNLFQKLGENSQIQAVSLARGLDLIE